MIPEHVDITEFCDHCCTECGTELYGEVELHRGTCNTCDKSYAEQFEALVEAMK